MQLFGISLISKNDYSSTTAVNDDYVNVYTTDAKTFSISFRNKSTSKSIESWTLDRSNLEWYLTTFFLMVLMDDCVPYAFQIDFSMMPSVMIKTKGCQFTIRTVLDHMRRMLDIVEKQGLPTSTPSPS